MNWQNDEFKEMKHYIFEYLRLDLPEKYAEQLTVKELFQSIDKFFDELIKGCIK